MNWNYIGNHITEVTGKKFTVSKWQVLNGGCINRAFSITDGRDYYFVKHNTVNHVEMFAAEELGLQNLWESHTIRVPKPICYGVTENNSYIVLEWLDLESPGDQNAYYLMGKKLAELHRWQNPEVEYQDKFGWVRNNTIGSTLQINTWDDSWIEFWTEYRLGFQLRLAAKKGGNFPLADHILSAVKTILANHAPRPSLVHGDLWGGNAGVTEDGEPVIYDPAVYWGDREVDLAMTELFGSFPSEFYQGYNEVWPLSEGYEYRKILYNLYHVLNHYNLFGGSYGGQANSMIKYLLRQFT